MAAATAISEQAKITTKTGEYIYMPLHISTNIR